GRAGLAATGGLLGLGGFVDGLTQSLRLLAQLLHRGLDGTDIGAAQRRLGFGHRGVHLVQRVLGDLRTTFGFALLLDELLRLVDQRLGLVANVGFLATLAVLIGV